MKKLVLICILLITSSTYAQKNRTKLQSSSSKSTILNEKISETISSKSSTSSTPSLSSTLSLPSSSSSSVSKFSSLSNFAFSSHSSPSSASTTTSSLPLLSPSTSSTGSPPSYISHSLSYSPQTTHFPSSSYAFHSYMSPPDEASFVSTYTSPSQEQSSMPSTPYNIPSTQAWGTTVPAAIQTYHTVEYCDIPLAPTNIQPTVIEVGSNSLPVTILFRSSSSTLNVQQMHQGSTGKNQETSSEDEPHILRHSVKKPIYQEIREIITPYRKIYQRIEPVQQEIKTIVARNQNINRSNQYRKYNNNNSNNRDNNNKQTGNGNQFLNYSQNKQTYLPQASMNRFKKIKYSYMKQ